MRSHLMCGFANMVLKLINSSLYVSFGNKSSIKPVYLIKNLSNSDAGLGGHSQILVHFISD